MRELTDVQLAILSDVGAREEIGVRHLKALGYPNTKRSVIVLIESGFLASTNYANGEHVRLTPAGRAALQHQEEGDA